MRILLTLYLSPSAQKLDLNGELVGALSCSLLPWEEATGLSSEDWSEEEVDRLWPEVFRCLSSRRQPLHFIKSHDPFRRVADGQPLFPVDATRGVLYLVRNPLDIAPSFAHHMGTSPTMGVRTLTWKAFHLPPALPAVANQFVGSWSDHVNGWLEQQELPMLLVRYEDLLADTAGEFSRVLDFFQIPKDPERLAKAVEYSRFERLQKAEKEHGFRERLRNKQPFFRRGQADCWRDELSSQEVETLLQNVAPSMQRLGYAIPSEWSHLVC